MSKSLIGIELNAIEVVMTNSRGVVASEKMPANLINTDGIVSPETLSQFLKKAKKDCRISGNNCAIILPDDATYFRTVDTPVISDAQLKLNLPYEFKDFTGVDSIDYNYDYMVDRVEKDTSGKPVSIHLYAAAAKKSTVSEYQRVLKKAGLKLQRALPNEVCILNLMKEVAKADQEYCLVGVGYDYTRVYILKGNELRASKVIEIGNHIIDKAIAKFENTDEYLAADLRDSNKNNILENDYLTNVYDAISLEVMKIINFYKYENSDSQLDTIHFFGAGAKNTFMCDSICNYIGFKKGQAKDILPSPFEDEKGLMGIGLIL